MRYLAVAAALLGLTGVALGAFGAHGLKTLVAVERLDIWRTAVSYQMYHSPILLLLAWQNSVSADKLMAWAGFSLLTGTLIFSGSLYLLVWLDKPVLGMITPIGGTLLMLGWLLLLVALLKNRFNPE